MRKSRRNEQVGRLRMARVKICGITDKEALAVALQAGADFIGLVFYPPSPRHLSLQQAARLAEMARGRARIVALVVDADDALLADIAGHVRPDYLQAHGHETPERVRAMTRHTGIPVIKAFRLKGPQDLATVDAFADDIVFPLFDAWHDPDKADLPGGMGKAFDWSWLGAWGGGRAFMLAGGLTPDNVAEAIARTGAPMVDVSSGVEKARGVKDVEKIRRFIAAARGAAGRHEA